MKKNGNMKFFNICIMCFPISIKSHIRDRNIVLVRDKIVNTHDDFLLKWSQIFKL